MAEPTSSLLEKLRAAAVNAERAPPGFAVAHAEYLQSPTADTIRQYRKALPDPIAVHEAARMSLRPATYDARREAARPGENREELYDAIDAADTVNYELSDELLLMGNPEKDSDFQARLQLVRLELHTVLEPLQLSLRQREDGFFCGVELSARRLERLGRRAHHFSGS